MEGEGKERGRHGLVDGGQQRGVVLEDELVMGRRRTKKVSGATLRSSQAGAGRRMARLGGVWKSRGVGDGHDETDPAAGPRIWPKTGEGGAVMELQAAVPWLRAPVV